MGAPIQRFARRRAAWAACCAVTLLGGVFSGSSACLVSALAPEPDPVPRRWQLEIDPGPLRIATVSLPDVGPRSYYYLTYTVMNNSGEDLLFAPAFELATDQEVLRSGRSVPLEVTREIQTRVQNSLVEDQISIIGQLLQGKENAKDGLVIWPANDLNPQDLTVYAAGFSGETAKVQGPDSKQTVILRKTLMLRYTVPGELTHRAGESLQLSEPARWIMR
jgi:hypothetical protein